MNLSFTLTAALCILSRAAGPAQSLPAPALPHTNLMVYRTGSGERAPVRHKRDWERRREEILESVQSVMGPLPGAQKRCPLDLKIETEVRDGSLILRSITYASEPGSRVPAFLLLPTTPLHSKTRLPGVLALHPTDMEYGNRVVVESLRAHYPPYARELAERGFVVLAPAYPLMANYQPDLKSLRYTSGSMKAAWDNIRGLDLLESLPFVKKSRFGAIGHSLGGHNAIFTAVFEPRLKIVISSCGFDSFQDYMHGDITGWTSERYMPKLLEYRSRRTEIPFDFYELIGALAPRTVFISAPLHDGNFSAQSVDAIVRAAIPIYRLFKAPERLILEHPDCAHEFPREVRQHAYQSLENTLR